jgi:hypothetical protein
MIYDKLEVIEYKCYICKDIGHQFFDCPSTHFTADQSRIILRYSYSTDQQRNAVAENGHKKERRIHKENFHTITNLSNLKESLLKLYEKSDFMKSLDEFENTQQEERLDQRILKKIARKNGITVEEEFDSDVYDDYEDYEDEEGGEEEED